jgi:hypothetical protein
MLRRGKLLLTKLTNSGKVCYPPSAVRCLRSAEPAYLLTPFRGRC